MKEHEDPRSLTTSQLLEFFQRVSVRQHILEAKLSHQQRIAYRNGALEMGGLEGSRPNDKIQWRYNDDKV